MNEMLDNDFMEKVPQHEIDVSPDKCFYLCHHPVIHKQKNKLRIVFDGSLKGKDPSLNDCLKKGPDLTNSLVGVLLRFRLENCSVVGDIEKNVSPNKTH